MSSTRDAPPIVDLDRLTGAYYDERPDPSDAGQRVSFGTSGHRGSSLARTFNEAHVLAMSAAVCGYRRDRGIDGPLFLAATRTRCPSRRSAPSSRYWQP